MPLVHDDARTAPQGGQAFTCYSNLPLSAVCALFGQDRFYEALFCVFRKLGADEGS